MREIFIATLLLGCLFAIILAGSGLFEFHDSYGRCWRCLPGQACLRCPGRLFPFVFEPPDDYDRTCEQPTEEFCNTTLGVKFPSIDIRFYWICSEDGVALVPCPCDTVFQYEGQACIDTMNVTRISCENYACTDLWGCLDSQFPPEPCFNFTTPPTEPPTDGPTNPSVPTAPNDPTVPNIPTAPTDTTTDGPTTVTPIYPPSTVPTAPTDTTTDGPTTVPPIYPPSTVPTAPTDTTTDGPTTVPPIYPPSTVPTAPTDVPTNTPPTSPPTEPPTNAPPTITTEIGGPGVTAPGSTTTISSDTTPAPCVCVVWWPCWCNPCWNMPCHSCNGCVGMMG